MLTYLPVLATAFAQTGSEIDSYLPMSERTSQKHFYRTSQLSLHAGYCSAHSRQAKQAWNATSLPMRPSLTSPKHVE